MNPGVNEQLERAYMGLWYALLIAVALFFVKVILSILLRWRVGGALTPELSDEHPQTFFPRVLSMVGMFGRPVQTLGLTRLRPTIGLRLAYWLGIAGLIYFHRQMNAPTIGLESLILALVVATALHTELYEITYDRADVTLPRWWFGSTVHRWRDLVAVTDKDPWMITMHFANGTKVKVHKYIVGQAEFMAVAQAAIRNI
jgi:hypothetical protein